MIKGTKHAQIHRGEKSKERREAYRLMRLARENRQNSATRDFRRRMKTGELFNPGKLSFWSKVANFFKNIYGKIKLLGYSSERHSAKMWEVPKGAVSGTK